MKITKSKLKRIIKEEFDQVLLEEAPDLHEQIQKLYDQWQPETPEGKLYKKQLGELLQ